MYRRGVGKVSSIFGYLLDAEGYGRATKEATKQADIEDARLEDVWPETIEEKGA